MGTTQTKDWEAKYPVDTKIGKLFMYREKYDAGTALDMYGQAFPEYQETINQYRTQYGPKPTFGMLTESLKPIGPEPPPPAPEEEPSLASRIKDTAITTAKNAADTTISGLKAVVTPSEQEKAIAAGLEKAAKWVDERTWGVVERPIAKIGQKYIQPFTKKTRAKLAEKHVPAVDDVKQMLETGIVSDRIKTDATLLGLKSDDLDNPKLVLGHFVKRGVMPTGADMGEEYLLGLIAAQPKDKQKAYTSLLFRMFYDPFASAVTTGEEPLSQRGVTEMIDRNRLTGGLAAAGEAMAITIPTELIEHPEQLPKMAAAMIGGRYIMRGLGNKGIETAIAKSPLAKRMLTIDLGMAFKRFLKFKNYKASPDAIREFMMDLGQPNVAKGVRIEGIKHDDPTVLKWLQDVSNRYRGMSPEQATAFAEQIIRPVRSRGYFKVLVPRHFVRFTYPAQPGAAPPPSPLAAGRSPALLGDVTQGADLRSGVGEAGQLAGAAAKLRPPPPVAAPVAGVQGLPAPVDIETLPEGTPGTKVGVPPTSVDLPPFKEPVALTKEDAAAAKIEAYAVGAETTSAMTGYPVDDVIFMRAAGMTDAEIGQRATLGLEAPDVNEVRQASIVPESSVVVPRWKTTGKVLDATNTDAMVVQLDSGMKITVPRNWLINADSTDMPDKVIPMGETPVVKVPDSMRPTPDFLPERHFAPGRPLQRKVEPIVTPPAKYYDIEGHRYVGRGPMPPAVIEEAPIDPTTGTAGPPIMGEPTAYPGDELIPQLPARTTGPPLRQSPIPLVPVSEARLQAPPKLLEGPPPPKALSDALRQGEAIPEKWFNLYPRLRVTRQAMRDLGVYDEVPADAEMVKVTESKIQGMAESLALEAKVTESKIQGMAESLALEANEGLRIRGEFLKRVLSHGGIRKYRAPTGDRKGRKFVEEEEYDQIPVQYRRKQGKPLDEIASEMGYESDYALLDEIVKLEESVEALPKEYTGAVWTSGPRKGRPKLTKPKRFRAEDFLVEANDFIVGELKAKDMARELDWGIPSESAQAAPTKSRAEFKAEAAMQCKISTDKARDMLDAGRTTMQQTELAIRRELVLKGEDLATSDDPLEIFLQRRGWALDKVLELRQSIERKLQSKLFGEEEPLSAEENTLQDHVQDWLDEQAAPVRKSIKDEAKALLKDEAGMVRLPAEQMKALLKRIQDGLQNMYRLSDARVGMEELVMQLDGETNKGGIISQWRAETLRKMGVPDEVRALITRWIDEPARFGKEYESLSPKAKELARIVQTAYAKLGAMAKNIGILGTMRENYITHVWKDDPKKVMKLLYGSEHGIPTKPSFAKERTIDTIQDGIDLGLTPELDPIKLLQIYEFELYRVAAAKRFVDEVRNLKDERGYPLIMGETEDPAMKAVYDNEYRFINLPGVNKLMGTGDAPAKVHPDVETVIEGFFSPAWRPPKVGVRGAELDLYKWYIKTRSFWKSVRFFNPIWHGGNIAANNVAIANLNPLGGYTVWKKGHDMWKAQDQDVLFAAETGVQVKHAASVASELREGLAEIPNEVPLSVKHPLKWVLDKSHKALFESMVRNSQLGAHKILTARIQKAHPDWSRLLCGKTAAQVVNDAYGTFPTYWMKRFYREMGTVVFMARNWCCDSETRAMTKTGWKYHNELAVGEEILMFDPDTKEMRWGKLNDKFVNPDYDGDMVCIDNYNKSLMMTPDHTCYVYNSTKRQYEVVKAGELQTNHLIPRVGSFDYPTQPTFDDRFVRLVGWMVTDGHFKQAEYVVKGGEQRVSTRGIITQSKPSGVENLKTLGIEFRILKPRAHKPIDGKEVIERNPVYSFSVPTDIVKEMLGVGLESGLNWDFLSKLTKPQLELLYETMMLGDGTGQGRFCGKKKEVFFMTMVQLMLGRPSTFYQQDDITWRTRVIKSDKISCWGHHDNKSIVPYSGTIWCPSVDTGFWVAERKGIIFVTGNTLSNLNAPLKAASLGRVGIGSRFIPPEARVETAKQYGKFVALMIAGGLITINLLQMASLKATNMLKRRGILRGPQVPVRTTFQNGWKHMLDVDLGLHSAKGEPLYMVAGIFRNMRDWRGWTPVIGDPLKTLRNKLEPFAMAIVESLFDYSFWKRRPIAQEGAPALRKVRDRVTYFVKSIGPSIYWASRPDVPKTKTEWIMAWTGNFLVLGTPGGKFVEEYWKVKARYKYQMDKVDNKIDKLLLKGKWDEAFKTMDSVQRYSTQRGKVDRIMRFIAPLNYVLKSAPTRLKMAFIKELAADGHSLKELEAARVKGLNDLLQGHFNIMYPEGEEGVEEDVQLEVEEMEELREGTPGTKVRGYKGGEFDFEITD